MTRPAVLFDMDGTLLDTAADFVAVIDAMRNERQLPSIDAQVTRDVVSGGALAMVQASFGNDLHETETEALRQEFLSRYQTLCGQHSALFDGMAELLSWLEQHHIVWGVVTNKPLRFAEPVMQNLGLDKRSAILVCPDHVTRSKPDPEPMLFACQTLALDPQRVIYIGDDERDIVSGREAGCRTIAACYGYVHPSDDPAKWQADWSVASAHEIRPIIEQAFLR